MFDDSLLESRPTPPAGGKRLSLPLVTVDFHLRG